jgi:lipopolysaccharide export system protein LptA
LNFFKIVFFILLTVSVFAQKVDITADNMSAADMKKEVHFVGNAKVVQGKSWIHGDEIIVYFDENNETKQYEAIGLVTFEFIEEKSSYKGSADKVTYYPVKDQYILTGKAIIDDLINKRHVNGDEITLDMITGNANVKGSRKKPVKFIFDMKDKK